MLNELEIARVTREITVIEARLPDRIRLLESKKRRLEARLAELRRGAGRKTAVLPHPGR